VNNYAVEKISIQIMLGTSAGIRFYGHSKPVTKCGSVLISSASCKIIGGASLSGASIETLIKPPPSQRQPPPLAWMAEQIILAWSRKANLKIPLARSRKV
jgi:hypothetical protein